MVADSHHFDEEQEQDRDPHHNEKLNLDPEPHKSDADPPIRLPIIRQWLKTELLFKLNFTAMIT